MRELYLGFYKELSYKHLIYISLAELIFKQFANFQNNKLIIQKNNYIRKYEKKILSKIYLNDTGKIFKSDLENWYVDIKNELIKNNYLELKQSKKYIFTKYFKNKIKQCIKSDFNANIIDFINSGKLASLKPLINNIDQINIPTIFENIKNYSLKDFYTNEFIEIYKTSSPRYGSHGRTYELLKEIRKKFKSKGT